MFDIHSHILFDVDDGSRSYQESLAMLSRARRAGIDRIVCTPHCRGNWWDYDKVRRNFQKLQVAAEEKKIQLDLGFEIHWKKLAEIGIEWAPRLTLGDSDLLLLEFSDDALPANWESLIKRLQDMGLQIVIAHPERYRAVQKNLDVAHQMKDLGCYVQLSANFMADGRFGERRRAATELLKHGLVDYVASDAHRVEHYDYFEKALLFASKF